LVATTPIAGSTLKAGPSAITITTEFPLIEEGNEIVVTDPNGKRVDTGILTVLGTDAVAEMKPLETSGLYKVTYLLLAEADIPLEGSFTFTYSAVVISTPSASAAPQPSASATSEPAGSNFGTNLFVIFLLGLSILVLIGMGAYARKIFKER
jgi:copper transport protein